MTAKPMLWPLDRIVRSVVSAMLCAVLLSCGSVKRINLELKELPQPAAVPEWIGPVNSPQAQAFPARVWDGGIFRLEARLPPLASGKSARRVFVEWRNRLVELLPRDPDSYETLLGVEFGAPAGMRLLKLRVQERGKTTARFEASLEVVAGDHVSETLSVDPKHVVPDPAGTAQILRDKKRVGAVYRRPTPERLWQGSFVLPIDSPVTSLFGVRRVYNGQMQSYHQGTDLRAPEGTPVLAPAEAKVAMAEDLYLTGKTVILDHGMGLFTIYAHLSQFSVSPEQRVLRGQLLGLSGMTGRASGPHLHWGANLHGVRVNPQDLLRVAR